MVGQGAAFFSGVGSFRTLSGLSAPLKCAVLAFIHLAVFLGGEPARIRTTCQSLDSESELVLDLGLMTDSRKLPIWSQSGLSEMTIGCFFPNREEAVQGILHQ